MGVQAGSSLDAIRSIQGSRHNINCPNRLSFYTSCRDEREEVDVWIL
jgi:hypothetical protein